MSGCRLTVPVQPTQKIGYEETARVEEALTRLPVGWSIHKIVLPL